MKHFMFLIFFVVSLTNAQNTLSLPSEVNSPKSGLNSISWLAGHWKGEAFGGIIEEIWSPPLGNSMMFSFKLVVDGEVQFYELGHIKAIDSTLVLQFKHFSGDMISWEDKTEMQHSRLVKVSENTVFFDDFTFQKISDDAIRLYVLMKHEDGSEEEMIFNYNRM